MPPSDLDAAGLIDPTQRRYRGCAKLSDFDITAKLGEGTFGVVSKGRSKRTGAVVALKKILLHNERDGFPITALREIKLLKMLRHPNVLKLDEMAVERTKGDGKKRATMYMITPYMDHDLTGMTTNPDIHFTLPQIKCYMMQLLEGLRYLHASNILHRDMKAANILISNKGILQIADFGLARHYDGPTPQPGRGNGEATRDYTCLVVTRWYRPPELLLQFRRYTPAIDMWGAGCVFAEMFERKPILEGKTDLNQAEIIFDLLGSPTEDTMPGWQKLPGCEGVRDWGRRKANITSRFKHLGPEGLDLLQSLLNLNFSKRINAHDAMKHHYFTTPPYPSRPEDLPTFEESHELDRRKHQEKRTARPPAPAGGAVGMGPDESWGHGGPSHGGSRHNGLYSGYEDRGRYPPVNRPRDGPPPGSRPPAGSHALPPRPPVSTADRSDARNPPPPPAAFRDRDRDRDEGRPSWQQPRDGRAGDGPDPSRSSGPPPQSRGSAIGNARPSAAMDRYVPSYSGPAESGTNGLVDRGVRDRDTRDRDPTRDRDVFRGERDWDGRDRDRDRDRDVERRRRTRSRSPEGGRPGGAALRDHRDRPVDRHMDRERDQYRR